VRSLTAVQSRCLLAAVKLKRVSEWDIPVCGRPGLGPYVESCWDIAVAAAATSCHLGVQVNTLAEESDLDLCMWISVPDEIRLDLGAGVVPR